MIDLCNTNDAPILDQDLDLILQQIEILFDTRPRDVLGDPDFGINFEDYLYNTSLGNKTVATQISSYINTHIETFDWRVSVNVDFLAGSDNDILMIMVSVSKDGDTYSKIYKVTEGGVSRYELLHPVASI